LTIGELFGEEKYMWRHSITACWISKKKWHEVEVKIIHEVLSPQHRNLDTRGCIQEEIDESIIWKD